MEGNRVHGFAGCNQLMGGYKVQQGPLTFTSVATTCTACAQSTETENAFVAALRRVSSWEITGEHLELYESKGKLPAHLRAIQMK